ncbi:MAG: polyphosphate polymerase domain-containing protein [Clostridium sp.]|nr:polyphosphate polymerase domain-containing protein [Clostridium sp.]
MITVCRRELKFMMKYADALMLQNDLQQILDLDAHTQSSYYMVRSLYFDSINDIDLYEKISGEDKRKKIRLRIYDTGQDTAKFEIKEKNGSYQKKTSISVSKEDACRCIEGDYETLFQYGAEGERLYSMLRLGAYRPAAVIEYDRKAYVYPDFNIRVTFDKNIRSSKTVFDLWDEKIPFLPVLKEEFVILEVKYDGCLLESVKRILAKYHLVNISFSKYGRGRIAIG